MSVDPSRPPIPLGVSLPYDGWGDGAPQTLEAPFTGAPAPSDPAAEERPAPALHREARPWRRNVVLALSDTLALALAMAAAETAWAALADAPSPLPPPIHVGLALLCVAAYAAAGLYAAFPVSPTEEVRTVMHAATAAFGALLVAVVILPGTGPASVAAGLPAVWLLAVVLTLLLRAFARAAWAERPWWGCPVVVVGAGTGPRQVVRTLQLQPHLGLRPIAVLHDDGAERARVADLTGVPAPGALPLAPRLATQAAPYAVLAFPATQNDHLAAFLDRYARRFRRVLVVSDLAGVASLWVGTRDVGGLLGFEVQHRTGVPWQRGLKRTFDVTVAAAGLVVLAPVFLVLAALIRLDSPGPAFFAQDRLGRGGRCFRLLKFRTMHLGAHERLREVIEHDPEARAQYERFAKLSPDPRVTRMGRLLRKGSLDELPQLVNVLRGEMSLVGPRAYLPEELPRMVGKHRGILHVLPGVTGLWQVSGRNELPFAMRLDLDLRYVRNWSFPLDLYLLSCTVPTVLFGRGAG